MPRTADFPAQLRVDVLGPLQLVVDGRPINVPGPKRRAVLALLAMAEGRAVSVDHLLSAVWPTEPPESARAALHSQISRLRGHLEAAAPRLQALSAGYLLALQADDLDAARARSLLAHARDIAKAQPAEAAEMLRLGRALWRGPVLVDLRDILPIAAWAVTLDELRRDIDDTLLVCALDAEQSEGVVAMAREAVAADPLREHAVLSLMRALAVTGRAADALRTGYQYRRRLAEETGLDPSPMLGEVETRIAAGAAPASRPPSGTVPLPATHLAGRESEVAALQRLVAHERLVTIVGTGGVGKTRIALEVARRADAATVLPLAPVTDPAAIPHALAAALDLRVVHGDLLSACAALLAAGPRLLVADNCEHLLGAARDVVSGLLEACPELTVLTTSREPLGLTAERRFRVAPLPLPDRHQIADLERISSVAVFVDRARRVRPGFHTGSQELRVVRDIVRRLDGIPLAIELAAGRLSSLGLPDLQARLDRSLDLLGDSRPAAEARHSTLRATIDWSYALLRDQERRLFRHLSVFPDGFDLATAEKLATDLGIGVDPAAGLAHLVDASMIEADLDGWPRYRMLETLRSFALDRLRAGQEHEEATERLSRWAIDVAVWIETTAVTADEPHADRILRRELSNLRAAWYLARQNGAINDAITLAIALADTAGWRDLTEIWGWPQELADDPTLETHPRGAAVLGAAATSAWLRGNSAEADRLSRRGLELADNAEGRWWCLTSLALVDLSSGAYEDAVDHAIEAAALAPRPDQNHGIAALSAAYGGDLDRARALNDGPAAVATPPTLRGLHEYVAGEIDSAAHRRSAAEQHYQQAIDLARSSGATFLDGIASVGLLTLRADAGHVDDALHGYRELIDYWERTGSWIQQWTTLRNLARLLRTLGHHESASFLELAAAQAPDAPAMSDAIRETAAANTILGDRASRIRSEAASSTRAHVLEVARQTIDDWLNRAGGKHRPT